MDERRLGIDYLPLNIDYCLWALGVLPRPGSGRRLWPMPFMIPRLRSGQAYDLRFIRRRWIADFRFAPSTDGRIFEICGF